MSPKNKIKKEPEFEESEDRYPLFDAARKILLASIGAIALAQGEVEQFVEKLVERGEIAEKDGKKLIYEILEKRKEKLGTAEEKISKRVERIFNKYECPYKNGDG